MSKTRRIVVAGAVIGALAIPATASAAKPADPGCFGQDRAFFLHGMQQGGAPGASEWGELAGERGSTNGEQNREWRNAPYCGDYS